MTEELEKYMAKCDKAIEGLTKCDIILSEGQITQLGYEDIDFAAAVSGSDEHEFIVYAMGNKRIVFVQTYTEREGGLYFQSLYADKETADEQERPLVEASVNNPDLNLLETILHFRGIKIPGKEQVFPDQSIYMGCHHYLTIVNNPALAERAIGNFKKTIAAGKPGGLKDERKENVIKAIVK
jgi:hypothetical protein